MFKLSFNLFALALIALPGFSIALPGASIASDFDADTPLAGHSFGCKYEVFNNSAVGGTANDVFGPIIDTFALTDKECLENCDKDGRCLFALYIPGQGSASCQQYNYLSYFKDPVIPVQGITLIRVIPGSCDKAAATPAPFPCTERNVTMENGCQFSVKCKSQIRYQRNVGYTYLKKSVQDCARETVNINTVGYAFEYNRGGKCLIATKPFNKHFEVAHSPNENSEFWQLVEGSCSS